MNSKLDEWIYFSLHVRDHITDYVIPQYGDYPDKVAENWSVESIKDQLERYIRRIGFGVRGKEEERRDALKIAHYACYLLKKLKEEGE